MVVATYGCGGDFSPTAPSLTQQPANGGSFGGQSFAVVSGHLSSGGASVAADSTGGFAGMLTPSAVGGLTITVQGTTIKTTTDASGNFRLVNVPSGTVVFQITGAGTNATFTVQGVGANQHVQITVQVQSNSAQVVQSQVEELDEFEGNVIAVDTSGSSFTLANGMIVLVNGETWWDSGGDLFSLADMAAALTAGRQVKAEGRTITVEGEFVATVVKAETDEEVDDPEGDVADFSLEIKPDEWRLEWADDSKSGSGGENLRARIEGGPFASINPTGITMTGPAPPGTIFAVGTEVKDDYFQAEFSKVDAIAIVDGVPEGGIVTIMVAGTLLDGTPWELSADVAIKEDDDDGDEEDVDSEDIAEAIDSVRELIEDIEDLVEDDDLAANNAGPLVSKLNGVIDKLESGNVTPAINELEAFINEVEAFGETGKLPTEDADDLIEEAEEIVEELTGD